MSVNKVILIGRLGKDVDLKYTPSQIAVANFSIATSEKYEKKDGSKEEKTEWHNIVVWGKLAELCNQYIRKGSEVYIEGSIQTRSYEKENQKRYITEVVARTVQFLGAKGISEERESGTTMAERHTGVPF